MEIDGRSYCRFHGTTCVICMEVMPMSKNYKWSCIQCTAKACKTCISQSQAPRCPCCNRNFCDEEIKGIVETSMDYQLEAALDNMPIEVRLARGKRQ